MVLMPQFADQIIPLAKLGASLGVDYLVIKHCSDDEAGSLGVNYEKYFDLIDLLAEAETYSTDHYTVKAKWSKILSGGKRNYGQCYGPPFIMQFSGSGLVAPCGMLFNSKYKKYHIGNIAVTSFKELWKSERYWQVINLIASDKFDARTMCGSLCLQHKVNEFLWNLKHGREILPDLAVAWNPCTSILFNHDKFGPDRTWTEGATILGKTTHPSQLSHTGDSSAQIHRMV